MMTEMFWGELFL